MKSESEQNQPNKKFKIGVIGLGLIGGSMAMALRGFKNAALIGVDINEDTRKKALQCGAVDEIYQEVNETVLNCDLIILCVYPHHIVDFLKNYAKELKPGCIVTDVCGAKTKLYARLSGLIPEAVEYIGIHPMAGKEVDGFDNAEKDLFKGTGFLITPFQPSHENSVLLMKELAQYIGAARVAVVEPEAHDDIIGYTSDLMHISATALCMHYHPDMTSAFTAGAFRDCTRIANINPALWTELLLTNSDKILPHLDAYIEYLNKMKSAIKRQDGKILHDLLALAAENKKEMLKR